MSKQHKGRKLIVFLSILVLLFLGIFMYCLWTFPYKLDVKLTKESFYEGEAVYPSDFVVKVKSVFGRELKSKDAVAIEKTDDLSVVKLHKDGLVTEVKLPVVKLKDTIIKYDGDLYAGQSVDVTALSVKFLYEDNTEKNATDVSVNSELIPMADTTEKKYPLEVHTECGDFVLMSDVILPVEMKAVCGDVVVGTAFNKSLIDVILTYSDGKEYNLRSFEVENAPEYFLEATDLKVVSDYGTTNVTVYPVAVENLRAEYDGVIYEGDKLDESKIHVYVTLQGQFEKETDDFVFINPGPLKMQIHIPLTTRYGETGFDITPIRVTSSKLLFAGEVAEGEPVQVEGVHLVYEDGLEKDVPRTECEFLNLPDRWNAELSTIWFEYNHMEHSVDVDVVPMSVVSSRRDVGGDVNVYPTYQLSDDDIRYLAIVAQKLGADHMNALVAELSLMANKYELAGGGDDIVAYVRDSGYWGTDLDSYVASYDPYDDSLYAVKDVLVSGHRALPLYVDEHALLSDVESVSTNTYMENETEITMTDGRILRYAYSPSDDTSILYCYNPTSYTAVTGQSPVPVRDDTSVLEITDMDDGILIESLD